MTRRDSVGSGRRSRQYISGCSSNENSCPITVGGAHAAGR
ncbi:hypothetical protein BN903_93 [Halorubrum sp. AJ67]|nr:hypothetical protein BN903_93 [Halorubrum sp. AJ67]